MESLSAFLGRHHGASSIRSEVARPALSFRLTGRGSGIHLTGPRGFTVVVLTLLDPSGSAGYSERGKVKRLRIYVDTSVIGGCFDPGFEEDSRALWNKFQDGSYLLMLSGG